MSWFAVSKAFCRSRNTSQAKFPESQACLIFSVITERAWVVEWLCLKLNCLSYRTSLAFKNVIKWLCMSLSKILLILESNEIVWLLLQLVWSSFLKIGIKFAVFKLAGKIPVENDKLAISDIGLLRGVWNNFRNLIGILEGPEDLSSFRLFISDRTSSLLVGALKRNCCLGSSDIWSSDVVVLLAFLLFAWQLK